jgi:3-keto-L-gulonate-6-phosphate decarboxylase
MPTLPFSYDLLKTVGFLIVLGWAARHYIQKLQDNLKEFMRELIAELIKATDAKLAYRDQQIKTVNRHYQMERHRTTRLALATAELGTAIFFPGPTPSRTEQNRIIESLRDIAVSRGIEPEDLEKLNEDWSAS